MVLHHPGWPLAGHVDEDDLELMIFLPPPSECLDCKCPPSCLVYAVLGIEPRAS